MFNLFNKLFGEDKDTEAFVTAKSNFTYIQDCHKNTFTRYTTIDKPFKGDCEDFALTLQNRIGGQLFMGYMNEVLHMVLVKNNIVYCNTLHTPMKLGKYNLINGYNFQEVINPNFSKVVGVDNS